MSDALFDLEERPTNIHAHTGPECAWCAWRDGTLAKAAAMTATDKDHEWGQRADTWLASLYVGVVVCADDLVQACGLPVGSPNQVGARFARWAKAGRIREHGFQRAARKQSHARRLVTWQVIA